MPTTLGLLDLLGALEEVLFLETLSGERMQVKILCYPSPKEVLDKMSSYDIVHFACHAVADPVSPSQSYLAVRLLLDSNYAQCQILAEYIADRDLQTASVAFLAACSSAENKHKKLAHEVLHLTSVFQVAGFSHVIGSLWDANDTVSIDIMRSFYTSLLIEEDLDKSWDDKVALSLHRAINAAILEDPRMPLWWAIMFITVLSGFTLKHLQDQHFHIGRHKSRIKGRFAMLWLSNDIIKVLFNHYHVSLHINSVIEEHNIYKTLQREQELWDSS